MVHSLPRAPPTEFAGAAAIVESIRDPVICLDAQGVVESLNPAAVLLLGRGARRLLGQPFETAFVETCRGAIRAAVQAFVDGRSRYRGPTHLVVDVGEEGAVVEVTAVRLGLDAGAALILQEDAEQTAFARLLEHEATHDALTGLANRRQLRTLLAEMAQGPGDAHLAVVCVGLDGLRDINDVRGYEVGDRVLVEMAARLGRTLPPDARVARAGGDEFVVLLTSSDGADRLRQEAQAVLRAMAPPCRLGGAEVHLSAGVGVAIGARQDSKPNELLRRADAALHRAKERGAGELEVHEQGALAGVRARHALDAAVRRADYTERMALHYQPVVDAHTGAWSGCEALLRWKGEDGRWGSPEVVVAALERTRRIEEAGAWVLQQACEQAVRWQRETGQEDLHVAVNLSVRQLESGAIVEAVKGALARSGLAASCLVLEVTESAVALDIEGMIRRLQAIRDLGVGIAIDDFGTGYSSLAYLHRLPADILKIDRCFVMRIGLPDGDLAILETIATLARTLSLRVVAEGIETPIQRAVLEDLGADLLQGYLFSRPLDADAALERLCAPPAPRDGADDPF